MANLTKSLVMPNGSEYEFVGKHWYGLCTTAAATYSKSVTITGFTSADLVNGTQVTVLFSNAQTYGGSPSLNVSNTGAKTIFGDAKQYEWKADEAITFLFANNGWYIVGSKHADTTYWGKTKLSNSIANDQTVALTPKAVYDAGYITGINSSDVTTALGYTPYNGATNPNGYLTSSTGVTSVNGSTGAVTGLQTTANLVTSVSSASTDAQYPSAKLFYDTVGDIETLLASI